MPVSSKPNSKLRVIVPILLVVAGISLAAMTIFNRGGNAPAGQANAQNSSPTTPPVPTTSASQEREPEVSPADQPDSAPAESAGAAPSSADAAGAAQPDPATPQAPADQAATPIAGMHAQVQAETAAPAPLGSLDPATGYLLEVHPTLAGAGIRSIGLADQFETPANTQHITVQDVFLSKDLSTGFEIARYAFATQAVIIDGQRIALRGSSVEPLWRELSPGLFEAVVVDAADRPVGRITKTYTLAPGERDLRVEHAFENRTDRPLRISWDTMGPIDPVPPTKHDYGGDFRRVRFATLRGGYIENTDRLLQIGGELKRAAKGNGWAPFYPNQQRFGPADSLTWLAITGRYFATIVFPDAPAGATGPIPLDIASNTLELITILPKLDASGNPVIRNGIVEYESRLTLQLQGAPADVAPGATTSTAFRIYAGPMDDHIFSKDNRPAYAAAGLNGVVVYNYGGMCAFCTFQWLARPLLALLRLFDMFLHDWALSIMLLVVCVKAALHPITRKSQIGMLRFGRQMQNIQPKIKKLQEKYANDRQKLQQEQMKLMKEEGVNYAGMLGCLPMFLQTPIWIALYAMLMFLFDLRHEPGFYGVFQAISGGQWTFLADLSVADRFIPIPSFKIPLLSAMMGPIEGINILPILLGIVYFFQQKYLTPPRTAPLTPEQAQQQKMMKVMLVVLFPLIMYNAPAALAIYFVTNSVLGIAEGAWIRAHVNKEDLEAPAKKKQQLIVPPAGMMPQGPDNPFKRDRQPKRFKDRN